jgi:chorismate mutase
MLIMAIRGIRGAITIDSDTPIDIKNSTKILIENILIENNIHIEDIASLIFSVTSDIKSEFPAVAIREMGWKYVPLMNFKEMEKDNALNLCIRVLMHWNTSKKQTNIKHVYLKGATILRPDLLD